MKCHTFTTRHSTNTFILYTYEHCLLFYKYAIVPQEKRKTFDYTQTLTHTNPHISEAMSDVGMCR